MRVVERFCAGKFDDDQCEDAVVVTAAWAAVLDGVTDKSGLTYDWQGQTVTSGRFAAAVVAHALEACGGAPGPVELFEQLRRALDAATRAQRPDVPAHDRPGVSVVMYSPVHRQVWSLGDCQFSVDGVVTANGKKLDAVAYAMRSLMLAAVRTAGTDPEQLASDPGRDLIQPFLNIQAALAHTRGPFGYGIVDGRPFLPEHVNVVDVAPTAREVVLASDGYPQLASTLADSEALLGALLEVDPNCESLIPAAKGVAPGASSFDDRSYLRLRVD